MIGLFVPQLRRSFLSNDLNGHLSYLIILGKALRPPMPLLKEDVKEALCWLPFTYNCLGYIPANQLQVWCQDDGMSFGLLDARREVARDFPSLLEKKFELW